MPAKKKKPATVKKTQTVVASVSRSDILELAESLMAEFKEHGKVNPQIIEHIVKPWADQKLARKRNPSRPSRAKQIQEAITLYENFSGHPGEVVETIPKPVIPDVGLAIGSVDGLLYTTVRDGKTEKYIHEFAKKSRPLFAVSYDGKSLYMIGGSYNFTERGIVDKTGR